MCEINTGDGFSLKNELQSFSCSETCIFSSGKRNSLDRIEN